MNRSSLAPIARQMMDSALANLLRDGYVAFATMIIGHDNKITPILVHANNNMSEREAFGQFLRDLSPRLHAIIIISEAWTLMEEDIDEMALSIPVSQHPKRVEGVFVTAQSCYGELLLTKTFMRDADNKPLVHGEVKENWTDSSAICSTGTFSNLFC